MNVSMAYGAGHLYTPAAAHFPKTGRPWVSPAEDTEENCRNNMEFETENYMVIGHAVKLKILRKHFSYYGTGWAARVSNPRKDNFFFIFRSPKRQDRFRGPPNPLRNGF